MKAILKTLVLFVVTLIVWVGVYLGICWCSKWVFGDALNGPALHFELVTAAALGIAGLFLHKRGQMFAFFFSLAASRLVLATMRILITELGQEVVSELPWRLTISYEPALAWKVSVAVGVAFLILLRLTKTWRDRHEVYTFSHYEKDAKAAVKKKEIILGIERKHGWLWRKTVALPDSEMAYHGQIVGSSGSGKTQMTLSLAHQFMLRDWPVFYMENKGDVQDYDVFLALAKRAGREKDVVKIDFADTNSPKMNMLRLPGEEREAQRIADQIVRVTGREPGAQTDGAYYRSVDHSRFLDMSQVMLAAGIEPTIKEAHRYFLDQEYRDEEIFKKCPNADFVNKAKLGLKMEHGDAGAILSCLNTWSSSYLADLINAKEPDITIQDIFEKNRLAYISMSVGGAQFQANALGRMMIALLLSYSFLRQRQRGERKPAVLIFEEFAEFVTPVFATLIQQVRSAGFRVILSHQGFGQLRLIEGMDKEAFADTVNDNTSGFKSFFNAVSEVNAEKMARMFGTFQEIKRTRSVREAGPGIKKVTGYSERDVESFHIHPNEFKRRVTFKAGVKLSGEKAPKLITTPSIYEVLRLK